MKEEEWICYNCKQVYSGDKCWICGSQSTSSRNNSHQGASDEKVRKSTILPDGSPPGASLTSKSSTAQLDTKTTKTPDLHVKSTAQQ